MAEERGIGMEERLNGRLGGVGIWMARKRRPGDRGRDRGDRRADQAGLGMWDMGAGRRGGDP